MTDAIPIKIVIPARYASSRLPGKPLADIAGKPMLQHVYERALEAKNTRDDIVIAADDDRIISAAKGFGAQVVKTSDTHQSGTDRIAEVASLMGWGDNEIVVNLQGDEPLMPPAFVRLAGEALAQNPTADMATASCAITNPEDVSNPNVVKLVTREDGTALYFSRAAIPFDRTGSAQGSGPSAQADLVDMSRYDYQRHLGLYAYRVKTLALLASLPPDPLELLEGLEQLRALSAGLKIYVTKVAEAPPHGVDTPADLKAVRNALGHFHE